MKKVSISVLLGVLFFMGSCAHNKLDQLAPSPCDTTELTFTNRIKPVFEAKCYSCHEGSFPQAGINLRDENYVRNNAALIVKTIRYDAGVVGMPLGERLSKCQVEQFEAWLSKGAVLD